jgi:hypothetical protein
MSEDLRGTDWESAWDHAHDILGCRLSQWSSDSLSFRLFVVPTLYRSDSWRSDSSGVIATLTRLLQDLAELSFDTGQKT